MVDVKYSLIPIKDLTPIRKSPINPPISYDRHWVSVFCLLFADHQNLKNTQADPNFSKKKNVIIDWKIDNEKLLVLNFGADSEPQESVC